MGAFTPTVAVDTVGWDISLVADSSGGTGSVVIATAEAALVDVSHTR
jgi:hypothetical protein